MFRIAVCGSGGKPIAEAMGVHYIQEVVANAAAVRALYPQTRTAIEMGGQDAKIIFFYYNEAEGRLIASDMRMNGSCAGGTGVFIDEVAVAMAKYQGDCRLSHYSALLRRAIGDFCAIPYDRSHPKPRVFVTGEYLVTFHPGSNFHIEEYLEANGMEVILPRMINVFRKDYFAKLYEMDHLKVKYPPAIAIFSRVAEKLFIFSQDVLEKEAKRHPLYEAPTHLPQLAEETESVMNCTFLSGEGWLIPGEIREYAQRGVRSFIILQPFGCLPNHICGRGVMKRIKEEYPGIQILPLDLDPDTSFANVENRLQMLILSEKSREDAGALQHQETELTTA